MSAVEKLRTEFPSIIKKLDQLINDAAAESKLKNPQKYVDEYNIHSAYITIAAASLAFENEAAGIFTKLVKEADVLKGLDN